MTDHDPDRYARVELAFDKYRASGLALMATIVGLSAAAFGGLFRVTGHREIAFVYMLPIALALLQQLTHYFGDRFDAWARHLRYASALAPHPLLEAETMTAFVNAFRRRALNYSVSDHLCWLACLSFAVVSIAPLIVLRAFVALGGLGLIIIGSLILLCWSPRKAHTHVDGSSK